MAGRSGAEIARLALLFAFLAALVGLSRPTPLSVAVGAPFVVLGEAIRLWAAGHLYKTQELITSGPYRFTRNPLYLGRFLLLTGVAIMAWFPPLPVGGFRIPMNVVVLAAGYAIFFGYYMPRKERIEPARLRGLHGARYDAYNKAVPALFPTFTPYPDNGERWKKERLARNRETLTAIVFVLLIVLFALRAKGIVF